MVVRLLRSVEYLQKSLSASGIMARASPLQTRRVCLNNATSSTSLSSESLLTPDSDQSETYKMEAAQNLISVGALADIANGSPPENPIFQCVQIKPMSSNQGNERYRVVMNDTRNFIQGMLGQRKCMMACSKSWIIH